MSTLRGNEGATVTLDLRRVCRMPFTVFPTVNPETLDDMLRSIGTSHVQFHETLGLEQPPCLNHTTTVHCLLGQTCLDRAIASLGSNFECTVQVFCIRPLSQRYTDGEIYQKVSRHMGTSRLGLADLWLEHLQEGKRKHLASLLGHRQIMAAMGNVLPFAGLWDEFLLGNWAKHLTAHCDDLINRGNIEEGFKDMEPFPHIKKKLDRVTSKRNILSLDCTIPSIRTFGENMRYLTIPAKIIERLVEMKPMRRRMQKRLAPVGQATQSLFENLRKDWKALGGFYEVAEGQFYKIKDGPSPELAFLQLFLVAWRNFPRLSTEAPPQDTKGVGMIAFVDNEEVARLCQAAYVLGFSNAKIMEKLKINPEVRARSMRHKKAKLTIRTLRSLKFSAFYPQLFRQYKPRRNPEPVSIQADITKAFFGEWIGILDFQASYANASDNLPQDSDQLVRRRHMRETFKGNGLTTRLEFFQFLKTT
ncbi:uncharacterized protein FMAN_14226 [Fusarium mangiferae]|uniref:Uncharacterized protein n=1 Tax=Fusarium mangiferae TaxID=192010 RepID=A0A1L7UBL8_FUSMA|nr:uncharacterized protein FMAN_14226 [Fusarium mangiferae]CVL08110.1 uncharacterized protein FMAN_14226 [Fusarium mangiferae]